MRLITGKFVKTKVEHLAQRPHYMARPTKADLFVKKECWLIYLSKVLIRFLYGNEQLTDNIWLRSSVGSSTPGGMGLNPLEIRIFSKLLSGNHLNHYTSTVRVIS